VFPYANIGHLEVKFVIFWVTRSSSFTGGYHRF